MQFAKAHFFLAPNVVVVVVDRIIIMMRNVTTGFIWYIPKAGRFGCMRT